MIPLWCYMRLFRVERVREADKGKNKGKKSRRNEITPGGGMKEICGFVRGQLQRWSCSFLLWCGSTAIVDSGALPQQIHPIRDHCLPAHAFIRFRDHCPRTMAFPRWDENVFPPRPAGSYLLGTRLAVRSSVAMQILIHF